MKKYTVKTCPGKCPKCSGEVAKIFYGYPEESKKTFNGSNNGLIVLGGCVGNEEYYPQWKCVECGLDIYKER